MGTRSLTIIKDGEFNDEDLCLMYRQFDGHPESHGQELIDFASEFKVVNGMGLDDKNKVANGAGCFAAQMIAHFKTEPGGIYIYPTDQRNVGEEYVYILTIETGKEIKLKVKGYGDVIFDDYVSNWDLAAIEKAQEEV